MVRVRRRTKRAAHNNVNWHNGGKRRSKRSGCSNNHKGGKRSKRGSCNTHSGGRRTKRGSHKGQGCGHNGGRRRRSSRRVRRGHSNNHY